MTVMKDELIYGINPVMEALRGDRKAFELFMTPGGADRRVEKVLALTAGKGIPVRQRDKGDLTRLCGSEYHQGMVLRVEPFPYAELGDVLLHWRESGEAGLLLVLDGVQDPHNLGALIRTAACAGAHGVVIPKDRAVGVTAAVEKSAAGATATVPVVRVVNIAQALEELKLEGFWIFGTSDNASASVYGQDFKGHIVVVIGGEGEGIRTLVRKKCDVVMAIPLKGGVNSLNASVAGGVVLFEVVRQRVG